MASERSLGRVALGRALVKFLSGLLAMRRTTPRLGMAAWSVRIAPPATASRLRRAFAVPRCQHDLELDQLIPLSVRTLALWNREQRLKPLTRGYGLLFTHGYIVSSFCTLGMRNVNPARAVLRGRIALAPCLQELRSRLAHVGCLDRFAGTS